MIECSYSKFHPRANQSPVISDSLHVFVLYYLAKSILPAVVGVYVDL